MCEGDGEEYQLEDCVKEIEAILTLINGFGAEWHPEFVEELHRQALCKANYIQGYCDPEWRMYFLTDIELYDKLIEYSTYFKGNTTVGTKSRRHWNAAIRKFKEIKQLLLDKHAMIKSICPGDIVKGIRTFEDEYDKVYEVVSVDPDNYSVKVVTGPSYNRYEPKPTKVLDLTRFKLIAHAIE